MVLPPPEAPNERWSMDFVSDALMNGTRLPDDFTSECLAIEVDTSIPGLRAARALERIAAERQCRSTLSATTAEFTGSAFDSWATAAASASTSSGLEGRSRTPTLFHGEAASRVPQRETGSSRWRMRGRGSKRGGSTTTRSARTPGWTTHAIRVCSASILGCRGSGLELGPRSRVVPGTAPVDGAAGTGLRDPSMPMVAVAWSSQRQTSNVYVS